MDSFLPFGLYLVLNSLVIKCTGLHIISGNQSQTAPCPNNDDCQVNCIYGACYEANIICPINYTCSVNCFLNCGCLDANVYATQSTELDVECSGFDACVGTRVYCPPNQDGSKKCIIPDNGSLY
eukprot:197100_1